MSSSRSCMILLASSALACACGSSAAHRSTPLGDAGVEGGDATAPDAHGSQSLDARPRTDTGAPPTDARADRHVSTGSDARADAAAPRDASVDSGDSGSTGPVLGEFCVFADPNLENYVRNALSNQNLEGGVPSGPIPVVLAARVTSLDLFCDCSSVLDFGGVECLTGLQSLTLAGDYSSLDRLRFLPALTDIKVQYASTLPSELASLTHLQKLDLRNDSITDLSAIAGLTSLTDIDLSGDPVGDVSALSALVNLKTLQLTSTQITSLAPLSSLNALETLGIANNQIADLGPISGLTSLVRLEAGQNTFTDLSPLAGLTNLDYLDVYSSAAITDFSPLVANTGLGTGDNVYASPLLADCASFKADAQTLTNRGVILTGFPTCP